MKTEQRTIVITGAESTGKSVLTRQLANHFQVPFISEYARNYIEQLERNYKFSDVEHIAREQIQQLHDLKKKDIPWVFSDTWLVITKIWFEEVFQKVPSWIEPEIMNTKIDLFLVCDINLPWVADSVRENGGERRSYLQKRYIETIQHYGFKYEIISGLNETRFLNARNALKKLTANE